VLADARVKHYFDGVNMKKQRAMQVAFLSSALGGPLKWRGKDMYEAHKHLLPKLSDEHFNAVAESLSASLLELGVDQALHDETIGAVAALHDEVLGVGH
jgi:hemoglobin